MTDSPLAVIAAAVLLGVMGQVFASLLRLQAIGFLLILGVAAGPHGLGIVAPNRLGAGLPVIVSAFIAIILFEGALTLRPDLLRQALAPVRQLITIGATITFLGAAALARLLGQLPWSLAFLFASLIVVTGPTVIAPILRRVRLLPRLHAILKSESILIDPVGVFLAVTTFQYVVGLATQEASWGNGVLGFVARLGVGTLVGGSAGLVAAALAQLRLFSRRGNEHLVNLGALGLALSAFVVANQLEAESGIMAVVVAGLILAALPIPFRAELETFKEQVTTLGVSVLFILLSANLNLPLLLHLGWGEVLLLVGLVLLVRPASVFLSTAGTDLTWREKTYLSLLAPRGILAAAMSSYFAEQLREHGLPGANRIELLVFFTIGATVCLQGGWAAWLARRLHVQPRRPKGILLVGINEWSLLLAEELQARGRPVLLLDNNPIHCDSARERRLAIHEGDATNRETYKELNLSVFGVLLAMTPNDAVNTLACDAASGWLGSKGVLQIVSKPGQMPRSRVRMGGRWALPTRWSHREIVQFLQDKQLRLEKETVLAETTIGPELSTSRGPMLPLLLVEGEQLTIAVEGRVCAANTLVIGLLPAEGAGNSGVTLQYALIGPLSR
jgi:NhaP-type Na+/H+ or K+/H+ antiporter